MDRSSRMNRDTANDLSEVIHSLGRRKIATATVERSPTDGSGRFTAIVSTFGPPPDSQGDVIAPGAFLKSIADWRARDMRPTVWWGHDYKNPGAAIGLVERMYETDAGLVVEAMLDLDHEPALAVYEGMLAGRLKEFSIGYGVIAEHREDGYNVLDEVELLEVSVVYAGANRFTRVLDIKTATTTSTFGGAVKVTYTDSNDPAYWSRRIDELEKSARPPLDSGVVDAFVLETRELMVREKLAEAEQAVWERSQVNVIDPVPVRVDVRMRPVTI
jgi:HK97 family phage prohead protease